MNDLISRSKLKKEAESLRVTVTGLRSGKGILAEYAKHYRESFLKIIDEQPTVEERPRGEWVADERDIYFCSVCDSESYWDTDYGQQLFNYCPYCGADMRKKVE